MFESAFDGFAKLYWGTCLGDITVGSTNDQPQSVQKGVLYLALFHCDLSTFEPVLSRVPKDVIQRRDRTETKR